MADAAAARSATFKSALLMQLACKVFIPAWRNTEFLFKSPVESTVITKAGLLGSICKRNGSGNQNFRFIQTALQHIMKKTGVQLFAKAFVQSSDTQMKNSGCILQRDPAAQILLNIFQDFFHSL